MFGKSELRIGCASTTDLGEVCRGLDILGHPPLAGGDVDAVSLPTSDLGRVSLCGRENVELELEPEFSRDVPILTGWPTDPCPSRSSSKNGSFNSELALNVGRRAEPLLKDGR